jgi:hypothetical protein
MAIIIVTIIHDENAKLNIVLVAFMVAIARV